MTPAEAGVVEPLRCATASGQRVNALGTREHDGRLGAPVRQEWIDRAAVKQGEHSAPRYRHLPDRS